LLLGLPRMVVAVGWVCRRADAFAEFSGAGTASHPGGWCTRSRRDTRLCRCGYWSVHEVHHAY
jgi:hypothetical protein